MHPIQNSRSLARLSKQNSRCRREVAEEAREAPLRVQIAIREEQRLVDRFLQSIAICLPGSRMANTTHRAVDLHDLDIGARFFLDVSDNRDFALEQRLDLRLGFRRVRLGACAVTACSEPTSARKGSPSSTMYCRLSVARGM